MSLVDVNGNPLTENTMPEQDEVAKNAQPPVIEEATAGTPAPAFDFGAGELGAKVAALRAELAKRGLAPPPAPPAEETNPEATQGAVKESLKGSEIDWSEFDLDPNYAHFYPRAEFTQTGQGPKWVTVIEEYDSFERSYNGKGVDKSGQPRGLGSSITSKLNSPPDAGCGPWKLVAVLPATMGNGAVLVQRKVPIVLPDPMMLEKETKVEAPTDPELDETDKAAEAWAKQIAEEAFDGPDTHAEMEGK